MSATGTFPAIKAELDSMLSPAGYGIGELSESGAALWRGTMASEDDLGLPELSLVNGESESGINRYSLIASYPTGGRIEQNLGFEPALHPMLEKALVLLGLSR